MVVVVVVFLVVVVMVTVVGRVDVVVGSSKSQSSRLSAVLQHFLRVFNCALILLLILKIRFREYDQNKKAAGLYTDFNIF